MTPGLAKLEELRRSMECLPYLASYVETGGNDFDGYCAESNNVTPSNTYVQFFNIYFWAPSAGRFAYRIHVYKNVTGTHTITLGTYVNDAFIKEQGKSIGSFGATGWDQSVPVSAGYNKITLKVKADVGFSNVCRAVSWCWQYLASG